MWRGNAAQRSRLREMPDIAVGEADQGCRKCAPGTDRQGDQTAGAVVSWRQYTPKAAPDSAESRAKRIPPSPNRTCKICGSGFYASPGHVAKGWGGYCSMACRTVAFAGRGNPRFVDCERKCKQCGSAFQIKPSGSKNGKVKVFCSAACRMSNQTAIKKCAGCGEEKRIPKTHAAKWKTCSQRCAHSIALCSTPNRTCQTCAMPFYVKPSDLRRKDAVGIGTFCSMKCLRKARSQSLAPDGKYASYLERKMIQVLQSAGLCDEMTREYRFHPTRKWRFDFAWVEQRLAVEVHGALWKKGGHTSGKGRMRDMEKGNEAVVLGWRVLEVSKQHIEAGEALKWILVALGLRSADTLHRKDCE